jgi:hypothetical protein
MGNSGHQLGNWKGSGETRTEFSPGIDGTQDTTNHGAAAKPIQLAATTCTNFID